MNQKSPVEIKRGTFKLTSDVINPKPEKRGRCWYHQPSWAAGQKFILEDQRIGKTEFEIRLRYQGRDRYSTIGQHDALFWLIVSNLEEVSEEPSDLLSRLDESGRAIDILDALFREGKCTLGDVQSHLDAIIHTEESES